MRTVAFCNHIGCHKHFGGTYCPSVFIYVLKIEAVSTFEMLVTTHETTLRHSPEIKI
jgi:hypothetical protein